MRYRQVPKYQASFELLGGVARAGDASLAEQWVVLTEAGRQRL